MAHGQDPAGSGDEQEPTAPWRSWVETAVITVAGPCLGYVLHPRDPWFVASSFSWLIFVPLFLGLRFGFAYGFGSALALLLGAGVAWQRGAIAQFPSTFGVGLLGVGMVAGEFCDL